MKISPLISNFTAGVWSPFMFGQADLAQWRNACKTLVNFFIRQTGGAQKRPGTVFISEAKDVTKNARLIPFRYSTGQAYVIEAGDYYMRFFKDKGQIINDDDTAYEIGAPFSAADVGAVRFTQDKDLMYLFHPSYPPQKLTRLGHDDWTLYDAPIDNGPYMPARKAEEIGSGLCPNGDFELDSGVTDVGTPEMNKQTDYRIFEGRYARAIAMTTENDGIVLDAFTTVTGKLYVVRFRVFTAVGEIGLQVMGGTGSVNSLDVTVKGIPENQWTEINRYFSEAAGGNAATVSFLATAGAVGLGDELISNGGFETDEDWYYLPDTGAPQGRRSEQSHSGDYSWWYYGQGAGLPRGFRSSPFITETDKVYEVTFWVSTHMATEMTWRIRKGDNSASVDVTETGITPGGEWTKITGYYTETAGGASAYIAFVQEAATGWIGIDDVSIKEVSAQYWLDDVEVYEVEAVTMTPSATTGLGITLTASSAFFETGHIGSFIQLTHSDTTGYARITGITSSTVAVADVIVDFGNTTAADSWREGAWSWKNGFPSCGAFFEQRLMCANTPTDPDGLWGSKTTEYDDFGPGVNASDALSYKLQADVIRWLGRLGQMVAGTVGAEYRIGTHGSDTALTPTNIKMTAQGGKGSADMEPINAGNLILFVQRRGAATYGKKIRELSYNYETDSFEGIDLTVFAEHITGAGVVRMALMESPFPILWACTVGGDLIGCTYDKAQQVLAWHSHDVGGVVEDICVIPGETQDDLYLLVNRTINGVDKRFIEVMAPFDYGTDQDDGFFVDCGLTYDGTATDTITGLDHLDGEAVAIVADGAVHDARTVASGSITLDDDYSVVHVGLPYTSKLETMPLQGGVMSGSSEGKNKRVHGVSIYFHESGGGQIGPDDDNLEALVFRDTEDEVGAAVPLFTGHKDDFNFPGEWGLEATVYIQQTEPLPMTILSMTPRYRTEDR